MPAPPRFLSEGMPPMWKVASRKLSPGEVGGGEPREEKPRVTRLAAAGVSSRPPIASGANGSLEGAGLISPGVRGSRGEQWRKVGNGRRNGAGRKRKAETESGPGSNCEGGRRQPSPADLYRQIESSDKINCLLRVITEATRAAVLSRDRVSRASGERKRERGRSRSRDQPIIPGVSLLRFIQVWFLTLKLSGNHP